MKTRRKNYSRRKSFNRRSGTRSHDPGRRVVNRRNIYGTH